MKKKILIKAIVMIVIIAAALTAIRHQQKMEEHEKRPDTVIVLPEISEDDSKAETKEKGPVRGEKQSVDGTMYFIDESGNRLTGWIEFKEGKYYFATDSGALVTGLQYIEENQRYYWFDEEGVLWGNFGILSDGEIGLIREAMGGWDGSMTEQRRNVIARGLSLIGRVTYSQHMRNEPDAETPTYLDCSSFVGNCYYYGAGTSDVLPKFCTDNFLYQNEFTTIPKEELIPGDIFLQFAEGHWQTGNHIGIYLGKLRGGEHVFMHCAGDVTEQNNIENRGIWITIREDDEIYRKYHEW